MSKKSGKGKVKDMMTVELHWTIVSTFTAGAFTVALNPTALAGVSTRVLSEADAWAHFRVLGFRFRLHPPTGTITADQAIGFVGGVQDTPPATVATVMELIPSAFISEAATVPTEWVNVAKSELAGPLPWYKAVQGAADATEESPGSFMIVGSTTDAFKAEFRAVFQFKTAVAPANTPALAAAWAMVRAERKRAEQARESLAIRQALAYNPPPVPAALSTSSLTKLGP